MTSPPATAVDNESQAAQVLRQGFRWLRFPQPLEAQFREHYKKQSHRIVCIGLLVALLPTIGFALVDRTLLHGIHVGFQFPLLLLCIAMTLPRFYSRWYQPVVQIAAPLFGLGSVLAMILMTQRGASGDILMVGARLLLIAFFIYFMMGLRMLHALYCNAIVLAGFMLAIAAGLLPQSIALYVAFALLCANIIGGVGAFALESANRTAFLDRVRLETLASLDGLTQLLNRQTYEQRAEQIWQSDIDVRDNAAVIMIDVDYFKLFNDHYGHQAGDDCLRRIARAVRTAISKLGPNAGELVGRYGGEEIIAMVFDCSHEQLDALCNSILAHIADEKIPHAASASCDRVSVSIGAALHQSPLPATHKGLTHAADRALYAAKNQGRNRAVILTTFFEATLLASSRGQRPAARVQSSAEVLRTAEWMPRGRAR